MASTPARFNSRKNANNMMPPKMPTLPERIAKLPVNDRGYPIPFFVGTVNGKRDFRFADPKAMMKCVRKNLCWICGQDMSHFKIFPIGPMCCVNRVSAEPPSHIECAEFAVQACPFLLNPNMERREDTTTKALEGNVAGVMIKRNPGVTALWVTDRYSRFDDGRGRQLFEIGPPHAVGWWKEGRLATRAEVLDSITSGLPALEEVCRGSLERTQLREAHELTLKLVDATTQE